MKERKEMMVLFIVLTCDPLEVNNLVGLDTCNASPMSLRTVSNDPRDRKFKKTRPLCHRLQSNERAKWKAKEKMRFLQEIISCHRKLRQNSKEALT